MIQLDKSKNVNTIYTYPDQLPGAIDNPSLDNRLQLTHVLDQNVSYVDLYLTNQPTRNNPGVIYELSGSGVPDAGGQYLYDLQEGIANIRYWGQTADLWTAATYTWGESGWITSDTIDSGVAFVSGSDDPAFNRYLSSNEDAYYTTYNQ